MYAVERLGSYITRGVYTVSGPFHPFGGAIDIIVVEQQDGSFRSSPWNVRFGKFQGVLKSKEKVVTISVNGVEANFHMNLDHKGEAYFLRESDIEEEGSLLYPSSSGEETDGQSSDRRPVKSKTCNYDSNQSSSVTEIDVSNGKIVRTSSRRARILGLVFGRKSMEEDRLGDEDDAVGVVRANSLERAELAADLLEVQWSTNLATGRRRKDSSSRFSGSNISKHGEDENVQSNYSLMENSLDHSTSCEETCSNVCEMGTTPFGFQKLEGNVEETGTEMQCWSTEDVTGPPSLSENGFEENDMLNSDLPKKIQGLSENNADSDESSKGKDSAMSIAIPQGLDSSNRETCSSKNLKKEQVFTEEEASKPNGHPSMVSSEISESSRVGPDGSGERALESSGEEVCVDVETLHETDILVAKEPLNIKDILGQSAKIVESETICSTPVANNIVSETYTQMVSFDSINGSVEEVEPQSICTISGFSNSHCPVKDEGYTTDERKEAAEAINIAPSEGSEEEQLLFGDLDDLKSSNQEEKEKLLYFTLKGIERSDSNYESFSSPDKSVQKTLPNDVADLGEKPKLSSNAIDIPRSEVASAEDGRMAESLPIMWSHGDGLESWDAHDLHHTAGHSWDSISKSSKWTLLRKDVSSLIKSDADKQNPLSQVEPVSEDGQISEELKDVPVNVAVEDVSKAIDSSGGSWRLWPFPFKRTRSVKVTQPALTYTISSNSENVLEGTPGIDGEKHELKPKVNKKKLRAITPTSEQLASLNLKAGRNTVTFTFSTAMLGNQQVDARIYLWRWDTRIVISDVDGTITKSDVLGQFMPLVGRDWSQTGVAHLFSAIKENGYQLIFLSARAISQAYHTRQFLVNLKQDGKVLPDGPVVISPDGLFPSLYREVIRRAPHEFKIACLEEIKALFPSDCNPFYAGFGNRDTDEFSYLKVGIPRGKIFIINPKGEVAVNRRIDTKSYTSLHALVHGMFPSKSSSEQEDFNSWNYWKLPPPAIDL